MSLLALQKEERRARILAEAQSLMAIRGWDGVTMRDLAKASRVSVPTVYNLVGGKDALLGALMEALFAQVSEAGVVEHGSLVTRARSLWRAGLVPLVEAPAYARELICLFASAPGPNDIRRDYGDRYVALMAGIVRDGQAHGELTRAVAPISLARTMYSLWVAQTIRWAHGEIDDEGLRVSVERGLSLLLLGLASGPARVELDSALEALRDADAEEPDFTQPEVATS
ncbi:MAG: TetR/AcrR family transcriptional regulator [Myxococcota bacterium]